MLVLSRKVDEKLLIGDEIVVTIIRIRGNVVRLGIEAPPAIRVLRSELALPSGKPDAHDSGKGGDDAP